MDSDYKIVKAFIKALHKHNDFNDNVGKKIGKKIVKDMKHKRIVRCPCRIFDKYNLNINEQCPNAIYTITNICYNCDKQSQQLGVVNSTPDKTVIQTYMDYSKKYNIPFDTNSFHKGLYKKYINQYIKIKITDYSTCSAIILFKVPAYLTTLDTNNDIGEEGTLLDKYNNVIGSYDTWIDYDTIITDLQKNEHNHILDPESHIPLLRYHLTKKSIYHSLTNRVYKKYRLNATNDSLYLTNDVIDN